MEEKPRFAVGIDVGTKNVRAVQASIGRDGLFTIISQSEVPSAGMRRGAIREMMGPGKAVDGCLKNVEGVSGVPIEAATLNINGTSIFSTKADGMISVMQDREIGHDDIYRLQDMAVKGKLPQNRRILDVIPYEYVLDGQRGIREPLGMRGARLEIRANVLSVLNSEYENLCATFEGVTQIKSVVPSAVAAAEAVLTEQQRENGVAVVDMGAATTGVAIYDEGELQYTAVIPMGGNDVTRDLATVLCTIPEVAEELKLRFVTGVFGESEKDIRIKRGRDEFVFSRVDVDEVVEARLEEIFEKLRNCLREAGYDKKLPEGLILTGGAAKMRDIDIYARGQMELAVRIGVPGVRLATKSAEYCKPEYAVAIGLMMQDAMSEVQEEKKGRKRRQKGEKKGLFSTFFGAFKA